MKPLPVIATVVDSYGHFFRHVGTFVRIGWLWLLVMATLSWIVPELTGPEPSGSEIPQMPGVGTFLFILPLYILMGFLWSAIAVAWHRHILLGEQPAGPIGAPLNGTVVRFFVASVLYFIGFYVVLFLAMLPAGAIAMMTQGGSPAGGALAMLIVSVLAVTACLLYLRFSLIFPAIAIGRRDFGLRDAWQHARGNSWRIFFMWFLGLLPLIVVNLIWLWAWSTALFSTVGGDCGFGNTACMEEAMTGGRFMATNFVANALLSLLYYAVSIGFLSFAYRRLVEEANA
ncbi:hypothetical protein [Oceanibacterium hippocampi]|uniref:Glycerophosphoryl diester phosphodiesterase membrane domain-containing protein n=1 Tax=Oceanibacterium hippocampi TaxID=745714 RepID=A0A1Y5S204_9PROT|nr:hypothetical protein [Oceanibacterium hippocampi]SLN27863.1 hypothetical protein OCH7691_00922 [Oceanibacterium hippocampi]